MVKGSACLIQGILIDPHAAKIEYLDLPKINDRALRTAINDVLKSDKYVFDIELENMDILAVDYQGHMKPRNWPFLFDKIGGVLRSKRHVIFGNCVVLGTDRFLGEVVGAKSKLTDIKACVTFESVASRREIFTVLEGTAPQPRPLTTFIPKF